MKRIGTIALAACATLMVGRAAQADVTLNSLRIGAVNSVTLAAFYEAAFGMQEVSRLETPAGPELFLNFGANLDAAKANKNLRLVIMHRDSDAAKDPIAHVILNVTDMAATVAAVKAAGGSMDGDPRPYGTTGIVIGIAVDPAGNRVELIQRAPVQGAIIGTGTFTAFVENMDRSLAFYHDVFGLEVPALPASGERPYNNPNPRLFAMFDIPGARERHQSARVPGTRASIELMDIQNIDHKTVALRVQDPGAATLVLLVRDIDATLAKVKQANVPIVTPGGQPVAFTGGARAILIRDIDNRLVEIRQPATMPEPAAPPTSDIVGIALSIAVADMDRTKQVYRDVLGFTLEGETAFAADKATQALTGLSKAEVRRSRVQAPGSALAIEFVEFKGVERTPLQMRIQDRGAARLQLRAQNIDAMVSAVKRAGLTVVSQGGVAVPIPPNLKGALVADPNNFFLTLFEPCDGCTSAPPPATR